MTNEHKIYDRLVEETHSSFTAFEHYRNLDPDERSIDRAFRDFYEAQGKKVKGKQAYGHWTRWSSLNNWVARAAAYDADNQREARKRAQEERQQERGKILPLFIA